MSAATIPDELSYTKDHEWVRREGDLAVIGITYHAQDQLGDVVFVELPSVGDTVEAGATFGTVESVKAVSDLFAPISGEVTEVNEDLNDAPESVNSDPYGNAWLIKVKPSSEDEFSKLLSAGDYAALVNG